MVFSFDGRGQAAVSGAQQGSASDVTAITGGTGEFGGAGGTLHLQDLGPRNCLAFRVAR